MNIKMESSAKEEFMRIAIRLAENNVKNSEGGPFGAVIVKDGVIVAQSANKVIPENDPTAHAEVSAIRLACRNLSTYNLSGARYTPVANPVPCALEQFTGHILIRFTTPILKRTQQILVLMTFLFITKLNAGSINAKCLLFSC